MDDDAAGLSGIPPRGLWMTMVKGQAMTGFSRGDRVYWGIYDPKAVGTVIRDNPDSHGRITVQWDGIGLYEENPVNLRPAEEGR